MEQGLKMAIGMTIAYVASFIGMFTAYRYYKKYRGQSGQQGESEQQRQGE